MKFILAALLLSTCQTGPFPPQPVDPVPFPPEPYDAAPMPVPVPSPGDDCGKAEENALARGCMLPVTSRGTPWVTVCRAYMAGGVDMHAGCVASAAGCDAITNCLRK